MGQNKGIDYVSNYCKYLSVNHNRIFESFASMDAATRQGLPDQLLHDLVDRFLMGKRDFVVANGVTESLKVVNRYSYFEMIQYRREYLEMLNQILDEYQARGHRLSNAQQAKYLFFTFFRDTKLITKWFTEDELVYPRFGKQTWESILSSISDQSKEDQASIRAVLLLHAFRHNRPQDEIAQLATSGNANLDLVKVMVNECEDETYVESLLSEWIPELDVVDMNLVNAVLQRCQPEDVVAAVSALLPDEIPDFGSDELYLVQLQYTFEDSSLYSELVALANEQFSLVATDKTYRMWLQALLAQNCKFQAIESVLKIMRSFGVLPSTKTWLLLFRHKHWSIEEYSYLVEYFVSVHNQMNAKRLDTNHADAFDSNSISPQLMEMVNKACSYPMDHLPLARAKIIKLTDELLDEIIDGFLELNKTKSTLKWYEHERDEMQRELSQYRGPLAKIYREGSKQTQAHVDEIEELKKVWLLKLSTGPYFE